MSVLGRKQPQSGLRYLAVIGVIAAATYAIPFPENHDVSKPLYEDRCGGCHTLKDLSGYQASQMTGLVERMRTHYGADALIDDEEAAAIAGYLESAQPSLAQNELVYASIPLEHAPRSFQIDILLDGLSFPASINFEPDGNLFVLERGNIVEHDTRVPGKLSRFVPATGSFSEVGVIENSDVIPAMRETLNGGAVGMALDPSFTDNGRLFICYHYLVDDEDDLSGLNRLSSFRVANGELGGEQILVDGIPGSRVHNGCRVIVGPDRLLYFATGEGNNNRNAQNLESAAGKVLRLGLDGSIPADNPFEGSPVWSYGHRNPQGLGFEPDTGRLWSTEHGGDQNDELNLIEAGMNYGWPHCTGEVEYGELWGDDWTMRQRYRTLRNTRFDMKSLGRSLKQAWAGRSVCQGEMIDRVSYRPAVKSFFPEKTIGISDLTFYSGDAFPAWRGSLLFVTLKTGSLVRVDIQENEIVHAEILIDAADPANYGRMRDVTVGPDGYVYVATNPTNPEKVGNARPRNPRGGMIVRLRPTQGLQMADTEADTSAAR